MTNQYAEELKLEIVRKHREGASIISLSNEYGMDRKTIRIWISRYSNSGDFIKSNNMTKLEREVQDLRQENKRLREENHHLQQAALILWKKKGQ